MVFPPVPLIRKAHIIRQLQRCGAFSEQNAKTFREAGIINPHGFRRITEHLIRQGVIARTPDKKYYLKRTD